MPSKSQIIRILLLSSIILGASIPHFPTRTLAKVNSVTNLGTQFIQGEPWSILWTGPNNDSFTAVVAVEDTVFAAGFSINESNPFIFGRDVLLAKYSAYGLQLWNQTWVTPYDEAVLAIAASEDFVYLAGVTTDNNEVDGLLSIVDFDGTSIRNVSWGTSNDEQFTGIAVTSNGVYLSGVRTEADANTTALLVRFDLDGNPLWNVTWNEGDFSIATGVAVATTEVYLVGYYGNKTSGISDNLFLTRYSFSGVQMWNVTWGGILNDRATGVLFDNNSIFVTGTTESYRSGSTSDLVLIKYNRTGILLWNRTDQAGSDYSGLDLGTAINSVFVVGEYQDPSTGWQTSLLRYDVNGTRIWKEYWGGEGNCRPSALGQNLEVFFAVGATSGWISGNGEGFLFSFHANGEAAPGPVELFDPGDLNTNGTFNVSWTQAHDSDGYIFGYELQLATSPTFVWFEISWTTNQNHFTVQDLTSGIYYFRVRARDNSALFGPWSNVHGINVTLLSTPTINPWLAPTILLIGAGAIFTIIIVLALYRWRTESLD